MIVSSRRSAKFLFHSAISCFRKLFSLYKSCTERIYPSKMWNLLVFILNSFAWYSVLTIHIKHGLTIYSKKQLFSEPGPPHLWSAHLNIKIFHELNIQRYQRKKNCWSPGYELPMNTRDLIPISITISLFFFSLTVNTHQVFNTMDHVYLQSKTHFSWQPLLHMLEREFQFQNLKFCFGIFISTNKGL